MEDQALTIGLSTSSSYRSRVKSHFELCMDFDDVDGDDELKMGYPCPFCALDFDLLELWCHIDLEHPAEAKSGAVNSFTKDHSQHKSRHRKLESYQTLSFSKKALCGGHWQSFPDGSSPVTSSSKTARDPFLSFLYGGAAADERENVHLDSSSEASIEEVHSGQADDSVLERDVQPSLSDKYQKENARRSEFVRGLLLSTILDSDF